MNLGPEDDWDDTHFRGTVNFVDFMSGVMDISPASALYDEKKAAFDKLVKDSAEIIKGHSKDLGKPQAAAVAAAILEDVKHTIDAEKQKLDRLFVACMKRSVGLGCDQLIRELQDRHAREKLPLYIGASIEMYGTSTMQAMKAFSDANGMDALKVCKNTRAYKQSRVCQSCTEYTWTHLLTHTCGRGDAWRSTRSRSRQCTSERPCRDSLR